MSDEGGLIDAIVATLGTLTLPDSSLAFPSGSVKKAIESVDRKLFFRQPTAVVTIEEAEWDEENPEIGTTSLIIDVWLKDLKNTRGEIQLTGAGGLNELRQVIRDQMGHLSGGPFMVAVTMTNSTEPEQVDVDRIENIWHQRHTFAVLRG